MRVMRSRSPQTTSWVRAGQADVKVLAVAVQAADAVDREDHGGAFEAFEPEDVAVEDVGFGEELVPVAVRVLLGDQV